MTKSGTQLITGGNESEYQWKIRITFQQKWTHVYMNDMGISYLRHACEYIWQIVSNKEKHKGENSSNDGCMIEKYDLILQWLAT